MANLINFNNISSGELFMFNGEVCIKIEPVKVRDPTTTLSDWINYYGIESGKYGKLNNKDKAIILNNTSKMNVVLSTGVNIFDKKEEVS